MNPFALLQHKGADHTVPEILQQPRSWSRLTEAPDDFWSALDQFLTASHGPIVLTGAGSSAYIGEALQPTLSAWTGRPVLALATTDLVTHAADLVPTGEGLCVSFGRSGNSPESLAAVKRMQALRPGYRHIAITCNAEGALAKAMTGPSCFSFPMPPETHDASLVMTSSFTTMYLAGLRIGAVGKHPEWVSEVQTLALVTESFIDRFAPVVMALTPQARSRIQYLGSGPHVGSVREMRLKMLEMSDGILTAHDESFLGLRHGPQVFVTSDTLVVGVLSANLHVSPYEKDLLKELRSKGQGGEFVLFVPAGVGHTDLPDAEIVPLPGLGTRTGLSRRCPDAFLVPVAVTGGQMLATVACVALGHKPDAPSASGTISRVVQGVKIHPFQEALA